MMAQLPPLRLTGAHVLRDGAFEARTLALADGRITRGPFEAVDLSGHWLLPGIVDMAAEPDPAERQSPGTFRARLAAGGVTTAWGLYRWSWEGGETGVAATRGDLARLRRATPGPIDLRPGLEAECHTTATGTELLATAETERLDLVYFSNRLARLQELALGGPGGLAAAAGALGTDPETLAARIAAAAACRPGVPRHLCRMAEAFDRMGISYGSLGDADGETREHHRIIGARLTLRPKSRSAAATAKAMNDPVLIAAADLAGMADSGARRASALVLEGLCDVLVSGAPGARVLDAIWTLTDLGIAFERLWHLASTGPAEVMGLHDRGTLNPGARADVCILDPERRRLAGVIADGCLVWAEGAVADAFAARAARAPLRAAAPPARADARHAAE